MLCGVGFIVFAGGLGVLFISFIIFSVREILFLSRHTYVSNFEFTFDNGNILYIHNVH